MKKVVTMSSIIKENNSKTSMSSLSNIIPNFSSLSVESLSQSMSALGSKMTKTHGVLTIVFRVILSIFVYFAGRFIIQLTLKIWAIVVLGFMIYFLITPDAENGIFKSLPTLLKVQEFLKSFLESIKNFIIPFLNKYKIR